MLLKNIEQTVQFFENYENTIQDIFDSGICSYCGACILVCPTNAITYEEAEITVNENCIKCGKCLQICSQNQKLRYTSDLAEIEINSKIANYDSKLRDIPIGHFENIYISKANHRSIKKESMVGGTTLALINYALKESIIDGAIVADFEDDKVFPTGKLITKETDLLVSGGSKYLPTLSLEKLNEIVDEENIQSLAITTLPCQAYAIEKLKIEPNTLEIASKIKLVLTLFCGSGLPTRSDLISYFQRKGVKEDISELSAHKQKIKKFWRLNPQDQQRYIYSSNQGKKYDFSARRILKCKSKENCRILCPDYSGYFADISLGGSGLSTNITITRTRLGENVFQGALKEGLILKRKFSQLNYFLIKLMGNKKREKNRLAYRNII